MLNFFLKIVSLLYLFVGSTGLAKSLVCH